MKLSQTTKEIIKDVAETQRKSFQAGRARVKQVAEVPTSHLVPEGVDAYRDIVKYNLKSQTKLGDKVLKKVTSVQGFPTPVKEPANRLQGMAHELVDSQAKLVDGLCDALIKAYPERTVESLGKALGNPGCKVRDAAQTIVTMEKEWVDKLMGKKTEVVKTTKRPTTSRKKAPTKKKARKPAARKPAASKRAAQASA